MLLQLALALAIVTACPPSSPEFPLCAWFGTGGCICCDWNESGVVDPDDLGEFLNDWGVGSSCADVTLDGIVDADDLAWFAAEFFEN